MAVTRFLARDLVVEVDPGSGFIPIGGLTTIAHAPSKTDADSTGFDSAGHAEHVVVERGETWTLTGFYLEDVSTGARDAGQDAIEDLSQEIGPSALAAFKITSPGGNVIHFSASADLTGPDGGHNDLAKFQAVLKVSGATTYTGPAS